MCAFGDPEAALIKFSRHEEARAAHSCPDAVLGNRFIRVFWHNPDRDQKQQVENPSPHPRISPPTPPTYTQSCSDVVFIRVFWHNPDRDQKQQVENPSPHPLYIPPPPPHTHRVVLMWCSSECFGTILTGIKTNCWRIPLPTPSYLPQSSPTQF